jgi:hypothetical protein
VTESAEKNFPAYSHLPEGFLLAQFSRKDFFTGNAAIYNNIIIFTSRYAYDKFTPVTASYSLSATTKDFGRVFFGRHGAKSAELAAFDVVYPDSDTVQRLLGPVRHREASRRRAGLVTSVYLPQSFSVLSGLR